MVLAARRSQRKQLSLRHKSCNADCLSLDSPRNWSRDKNVSTSNLFGRCSHKTLGKERKNDTGKGKQSIEGVLLSKLPLWVTGAQFNWASLGDSIEHVSVIWLKRQGS